MKTIILVTFVLSISNILSQPFSAENIITNDASPRTSVSGDIDGDGDLDVVVASRNDNKIGIYKNNGNQIFGSRQIVGTTITDIEDIVLFDIDGDGDLDIFVGSSESIAGGIFWYTNNGGGTFSSKKTILDGSLIGNPNCDQLILSDIDNDSLVDVVGVSFSSDWVYYHKNIGSGLFSNRIIIYNNGGGVSRVGISDIDNDGRTEVIIGNNYYNNGSTLVHRVLNIEYISSSFSTHVINTSSVNIYYDIALVDLNQNGNKDIIVGGSSLSHNRFLTLGHNNFSSISSLNFTGNIHTSGDINGDGKNDVITVRTNSSFILGWKENLGTGNISGINNTISNSSWSKPFPVDLDMDGDLDIVTSNQNANKVVWFENLRINCSPINTNINDTICQGDSMFFNGSQLTSAGTYYDTLQNISSCDSIITLSLTVTACILPVADSCSGLFFSEYIEGSSNNKAIEIYNASSNPIDLSLYEIKKYINGSLTGTSIALTGMISAYGTHIVAHISANAAILGLAHQTTGSLSFTGNDAVSLERNDTLIDLIGVIGQDPGTQWGVGTQNHTLVRKSNIVGGVKTNPTSFDPATEWGIYAQDVTTYLGVHTNSCANTTGFKNELINTGELLIHPNPAKDNITISTNLRGELIFYIFNVNGKLVKSGKLENSINVFDIESGMYLIKVVNQEGKQTVKRIVVSK